MSWFAVWLRKADGTDRAESIEADTPELAEAEARTRWAAEEFVSATVSQLEGRVFRSIAEARMERRGEVLRARARCRGCWELVGVLGLKGERCVRCRTLGR